MTYSLVDMMNLARTRMILGSGYSSYSEVASQMGGKHGNAVPILMAGRDFGNIVERQRGGASASRSWADGEPEDIDLAGFGRDSAEKGVKYVQEFWPEPF